MHAVVNHLPIKPGTDWTGLARKFEEFRAMIKHPEFRGAALLRAGENEGIVIVVFETRQTLDELSQKLAAPWFAENVRPLLAGPVARSVGEVIAGAIGTHSP
jgi:hypothetical protein